MEKLKEESEKKLEDEKKLTEANTKSHQAELQNKQDVSTLKEACLPEYLLARICVSFPIVFSKAIFTKDLNVSDDRRTEKSSL